MALLPVIDLSADCSGSLADVLEEECIYQGPRCRIAWL